MNETLASDALE